MQPDQPLQNQASPEPTAAEPLDPSAFAISRLSETRPLTSDDLALVDRVGQRLNIELRAALQALDLPERTVRTVAESLAIGRNVSERALAAARPGISGREVIEESPGVEGLRILAIAIRERRLAAALCDRVDAAIEEFVRLIQRLGPSHAKLQASLRNAALSHAPYDQTSGYFEDLRKRAFRVNRDLCGTEIQTHTCITLARPLPSDPGMMEAAGVSALLGSRSRHGGTPLVISASYAGAENYAPDTFAGAVRHAASAQQWTPAGTLLEDFSTSPLPRVTARGPRKAVVNVIDAAPGTKWPVDIVIARRFPPVPHTRVSEDKCFNTVTRIRTPAQRLVFDLYVHKSMTTPAGPLFTAFYWSQATTGDPAKDWAEQLPGTPPLQLLGRGLQHAAHPAWTRHGELARTIFDRLDWPADEFVGFRADIPFPVWAASYCITFDYTDGAE